MERLAKISRDELIARMRAEFEKVMAEVTAAVNAAPEGHLIDGSEERCRDVLGEFRRLAYQTALQMRVEATETDPAFSPCAAGESRGGQPQHPQRLRKSGGASPSLRETGRHQPGGGG